MSRFTEIDSHHRDSEDVFIAEALADGVGIPIVSLPNHQILEHEVEFGWDNFLKDEMENLIKRTNLIARPQDYEMRLTNCYGTIVLCQDKVVEAYRGQFLTNCRIDVEPIAGAEIIPLSQLGVKAKEKPPHLNKDAIEKK